MIWPWQDANRNFSGLKSTTFALMFVPAVWLVHDVAVGEFGPVPLGGLTYWSGVWATAILLLALAVTPAASILRARQLIVVRRMIGVTALVYTIAHMFIYFALRFWNFSFILNEMTTRLSLVIATVSTVGLIALGITSFDAAIRYMGAKGWQRLHDTVYVVTALAILHYMLSRGIYPDEFLMGGVFFWLIAWRALERRRLGAHPGALLVLALASTAFTALIEVAWIRTYHGYKLPEIVEIYFSSTLGIPPMWKMLVLGIAVAVAAAARQAPHLKASALRARRLG